MDYRVFKLIFGVLMCGILAGTLVMNGFQKHYAVSLTILVNKQGVQQTDDYRYGGYYELQAAEQFSSTVQNFFVSPENVRSIFEQASLPLPSESLRQLSSFFAAEAVSPQQVEVRFVVDDHDEAETLSRGVVRMTEDRVSQLNELSDNGNHFAVRVLDPIVVQQPQHLAIRAGIGCVLGIFLTFLFDAVQRALKYRRMSLTHEHRN